jgi:hypothetical protein
MEDTSVNNNNGNNSSNNFVVAPPAAASSAPAVDMSAPVSPVAPVAPMPAPDASMNNMPMPASPYGQQKFDILRDVNWTETLLFGLFGTAFAYVIFYYRFKLKEDKIINSDIQRQLDNQNMRIGKVETGLSHARIAY